MTTYYHHGTERQVIRCNWAGVANGYIVRRISQTGHVTGHLTARRTFARDGKLAQVFTTAQAAANAASRAGVRNFQVLCNANASHTITTSSQRQ